MLIFILTSLAVHATAPFDCDQALNDFLVRPQPAAVRDRVVANRALGQSWRTATRRRHEPVPGAELLADAESSWTGTFTEPFAAKILTTPSLADDSRLFAIFLEPAEVDKFSAGRIASENSAEAPEALAFLRYERRGRDFVITDARGEAWDGLTVKGRDRYRGWPSLLLLAFERFAAQISDEQPWRVVVSNARGAPTLRRPALRLGYHSLGAHGADGFAISNTQTATSLNPARVAALKQFTFKRRYRWTAALAEVAKATPKFSKSAAHTRSLNGGVAGVRFTLLPAPLVYETNNQRDAHGRVIKELPAWAGEFTKTSVVSLACGQKRSQLSLNDREVTVTLPSSLNRPGLIARHDQPGYLLVFGVGERSLGRSGQIFTPRADGRVSGGVMESEGIAEFRRHLRLRELGERAGISTGQAQPVGVGWPEQFPRVVDGARVIVPTDKFVDQELRQASERLVQTQYYVRSMHRISAIEAAVQANHPAAALEPLLRDMYAAFGEPLVLPENLTADDSAETFLRATRALNLEASERVLNGWLERSLGTLGLVHGAGYLLQNASPGHNLTLAGELVDLDSADVGAARADRRGLGPLWNREILSWTGHGLRVQQLLRGEENLAEIDVGQAETAAGAIYRRAFAAGEGQIKD